MCSVFIHKSTSIIHYLPCETNFTNWLIDCALTKIRGLVVDISSSLLITEPSAERGAAAPASAEIPTNTAAETEPFQA